MPKGGLEEVSLCDPEPAWPSYPLGWYRNYFNFPLLTSCSKWFHKVLLSSMVSSLLLVLAMKAFVALCGVSSHLIWSFKVWLILDFFQDLMYWLPKHRANHLSSSGSRLPSKVPPMPVIVVSVWPKIPSILKDQLIPLPLLLVFLDPFILINTIHELTHILNRLPSQRFPQVMLDR